MTTQENLHQERLYGGSEDGLIIPNPDLDPENLFSPAFAWGKQFHYKAHTAQCSAHYLDEGRDFDPAPRPVASPGSREES